MSISMVIVLWADKCLLCKKLVCWTTQCSQFINGQPVGFYLSSSKLMLFATGTFSSAEPTSDKSMDVYPSV